MILGVVFGLRGATSNNEQNDISREASNSTESPAMSPTASVLSMFEDMLPNYTLQVIAEDADSPQRLAYNWMLKDMDELSDYVDQEWRLKQRFALAVFFYATNGRNWKNNMDWVGDSETHECEWDQKASLFSLGGSNTSFLYQPASNFPCDSDMRYEELWLWANELYGRLPPEFFWLTSLRSISIESQTDDSDHTVMIRWALGRSQIP
mgnify:CR=1 FL=1